MGKEYIVPTPQQWARVMRGLKKLDSVRASGNVTIVNTADALTFSVPETPQGPERRNNVQLIRVGTPLDGQGKFDAWTLLPTTNTAHLGTTNNVALGELFDDNEKIVFWDARDDGTYNSPSGTNRVHSFAGEFIPAVRLPFTEGTGSNTVRVFATYAPSPAASGSSAELLYVVGPANSRDGIYYVIPCVEPADGLDTSTDFNVFNGSSGAWSYYNGADATNVASIGLNAYEINGAGTPLDLTSMTAEERVFIGWKRNSRYYDVARGGYFDYYLMEPLQFKNDCDT